MRVFLYVSALAALLGVGCYGYAGFGWGYGWCYPHYDPYCYDYYYAAWTPEALAIDDLDADGALDLAVADPQTGNLWFVRGQAAGGFAPVPSAPLGTAQQTAGVAVVDGNGDAFPDLLVLHGDPGVLTTYLGDGKGGFAPAAPAAPLVALTLDTVTRFASGPLDGDAFDDLVSMDQGAVVHVALGVGDGTFTEVAQGDPASDFLGPDAAPRLPGLHLALAPFDDAAGLDLLIVDGVRGAFAVCSGNGDGTFGPPRSLGFRVLGDVLDVAPVVVQGRGAADLAVLFGSLSDATRESKLVVVRSQDGGFDTEPLPVGSARALHSRDLDGDGVTELLLADTVNQTIRTLHARRR